MSTQQTIGGTLTGGIQDISAILPLLGTEQCENHVGSALDGGYLYAAAAPLSTFGSLGVVKAGISILIASISVPKLIFSFSWTPIRFSQNRWMGAKTLQNAGYKLPGIVAPLIAMDGLRYHAETRLLQILEEKHIDDPEKLSIEWKSKQWNIMLIFSTFVLAILSGAPYFALLRGSTLWRPSTHTPWIFPLLRTAGSCLATICCQYLIQTRVISIMKNHLLFMTIHRHLIKNISKGQKEDIHFWARRQGLIWDESLPSEDCLWNLEQILSSNSFLSLNSPPLESELKHLSIPMGGSPSSETNFKLNLGVAPLIGMEGDRFRAETRLIEMLEEKHIDDPAKVSVNWKSRKWNTMLVLSTILGSFLSVTPYIALLLGPVSWQPSSVHLPWLFPALRIVGSCTAIVACQFIIQSRVVSLMKNRILFMTIHEKLKEIHKDKFNAWLKDSNIKWDATLPAEQCIWNLERYLSVVSASSTATTPVEDSKSSEQSSVRSHPETPKDQDHIAIAMNESIVPSALSSQTLTFKIDDLRTIQHQHFPNPLRDTAFISLSWLFLLLSLPATVAGYIGCFTLVSATPSLGNGPLIWVGLESALSLLRIFIWASNPAFDEETEVTLGIKLSDHQPMVTTNDYNPFITDFHDRKRKPFALIPEREFLEHITPYTGPLNRFEKPNNVTLYFTLTAHDQGVDPAKMCLIMTVFVSDTQIGTSIIFSETSFQYIDVAVKYDNITRQLEGNLQSEIRATRPWREEDDSLFDALEGFYHYITGAINQRDVKRPTATLFQKWDLSGNSQPDTEAHIVAPSVPIPQSLSPEHALYLDRGHEYYFKSELIDTWSDWIRTEMECLREDGSLECWEALRDATSEKGKWELTELDCQLAWGWARRELELMKWSMDLEDVLRTRMKGCVSQIVDVRKDERLRARMNSESERLRRKRMELERVAARKRMEAAMKDASEQADKEGRPWQGDSDFLPKWAETIEFIDKQWLLAIGDSEDGLKGAEDELQRMWERVQRSQWVLDSDEDRNAALQHLRVRVSHERWRDQGQFERQMMEATFEAIRKLPTNSTREQLADAYNFPQPDQYATSKFAYLRHSSSLGKACSAMVWDAVSCAREIVCDIIAKNTTRSVVDVDPKIVASIPPNDHILFLSCADGRGEEPAFVRQNRDRWPSDQIENSSRFYFTPYGVDGQSCRVRPGKTIAHIFVFLTTSCVLNVSLIHHAEFDKTSSVSLRKHDTELANLSDISNKFRLDDFPPFVLPEGRHELILVPQSKSKKDTHNYYLRDILIKLSDITTIE